MSDWIIDVPATIENEGSRHIECTDCGTVLKIEEIPSLPIRTIRTRTDIQKSVIIVF